MGVGERALFFITVLIVLTALAAILILLFAVRIKGEITADNLNISVIVSYLWVIRLRKRYIIKREEETFLALYLITRKGEKAVISLPKIIKKMKIKAPTDIAFADLLTMLLQSHRKKKERSAYSYIFKKARYDITASIGLGTGDAFVTAIVCGVINAAAGVLSALHDAEKHTLCIIARPEFSKPTFSVKANCIIALTPADIIIGYAINKKNKRR